MAPILTMEQRKLPETIQDVPHLEDLLSTPTQALVADFRRLEGDIMVLGVGGKVGTSLAVMARRAAPGKRVIGVARFSDPQVRRELEENGVECLQCDLLERGQVAALPDIPNIIYMAGKKFGTKDSEPYTWAMNVVVPTYVAERFNRSRIVAFSTLCVYPFAPIDGPGSPESAALTPLGEYANSCVGRERVFQYFSRRNQTAGRLIRLNYAIDLRYGVLHDVAMKVLRREPIDIRTAVANVIWQGDAVAHILRSLLQCTQPASPLNIGMRQPVRIRAVAQRFGELFGMEPLFQGAEQTMAWHNDCSEQARLFGEPLVDVETMIRWNADWLLRGMPVYDKPTHYEEREGVF